VLLSLRVVMLLERRGAAGARTERRRDGAQR